MYSNYLLVLIALCCWCCVESSVEETKLSERNGDKFNYFGFGSNMLTKRIHLQNPTAQKIGMVILKDYRLDFNTFSQRWGGAPATIVPTPGAYVYGTLWEMELSKLSDLDDQEGVDKGIYYPFNVPILLPNNTMIIARTYHLAEQPTIPLNSYASPEEVPLTRQPSKTYLQCLVKGAEETGIVPWYVDWLKSLKHNGYVALDLEQLLELKDVQLA